MNHTRVYFLFFLFALILFFAGCRQSDNPIVQPENSQYQPGNEKTGNGPVVPQPTLVNGNMEDGINGYWAGGNFSGGRYSFNYSGAESVSPSHSLNIVASGTSGSFAYWAQTFDAASFVGKKITVTVSAKYSSVSGDGVMLVLRGDDTDLPSGSAEAFSTTQNRVLFNSTSDWKTIQVALDPVPEGIKSLTVYMLISASSGSVYFDDLSLAVSEASPPQTDLANGDFESGNYSPDNWWYGSANMSAFNFVWDTSEYLSANHSARISSNGSGDNFAIWAQTISADQLLGKKITLNVHIKANDLTGNGVYIAIRGDDSIPPTRYAAVFATSQGNQKIDGSFDWKNYTVTMDKVPSNIKTLIFYIIYGEQTSGSIYIDDVSLTKE